MSGNKISGDLCDSMVRAGMLSVAIMLGLMAFSPQATTRTSFKVPVTLYDYHEEWSNPEFEPQWGSFLPLLKTGLVLDTLDNERKMIKNPLARLNDDDSSSRVDHLNQWFRPWTPQSITWILWGQWAFKKANQVSVCAPLDSSLCTPLVIAGDTLSWICPQPRCSLVTVPPDTITADTVMKSIMVADSLTFIRDSSLVHAVMRPVYKLKVNATSAHYNTPQGFYPVDNKGFEALGYPRFIYRGCCGGYNTQNIDNNLGFTMELHNQFVYRGGEYLDVGSADDEIWVFINNLKVVDFGGIHSSTAARKAIFLDSLSPALTVGQTYTFDLFYAERKSWTSTFLLHTDLEFVDKNAGIDTFGTAVVAQREPVVNGRILTIGNIGSVTLQSGAAVVQYAIVNAQGKTLVQNEVRLGSAIDLNVAVQNRLPVGLYFVSIRSYNSDGKLIDVAARRVLSIR